MSTTALTRPLAALLNQAIGLQERRQFGRAELVYRQLITLAPRNADVCECFGVLLQQVGKHEEAMHWFETACRLDERRVSSSVRLTWALTEAGRPKDAAQVGRRLTDKVPRSAPAWNALGYATKLCGRIADARECHVRAVTLDPKYADGWFHLGLTDSLVGSNVDALHHYDRALALNPRLDAARYGRAQALLKLYRVEEAGAEFDACLKTNPANLEVRSHRLFALQMADGCSRDQIFAEHQAYGRLLRPAPEPLVADRDPDRRLRLGILSPDLRTHSCAYFLEPLLKHIDRAGFEVYLYHDHFVEDVVSARFRALAVQWRNFVGQGNDLVEQAIRADGIDVLIDLAGHASNTVRLPALARRVAPVQITYLGYPDTTGLQAIDYRFTDAVADPPGEADLFATEKLVRFAPVAWTYQPPEDAPTVVAPPAASGSPVTFGCFNTPAKFTAPAFAAWGRILAEVPLSRLLIKGRDLEHPEIRAQLLQRMERAGVPQSRVDLLSRTAGTPEHLAQYGRVDVALDTFPYNGTTTTCEALWMGRPVVTLRGDRHAARVGMSLLTAVGHPEWIAGTVDEYVGRAVELARAGRTEGSTWHLREEVRNSRLLDHAKQAADFANAIRRCWREKVALLPG